MTENKQRGKSTGAPPVLTEALIEQLVEAADFTASIRQMARLTCQARENVRRWLAYGERDVEAGKESIYASLWVKVEHKIGNSIQKLVNDMAQLNSFQSKQWILEKVYSEEFGANNDTIKELISNINTIARCHQENN